MKFMKFFYDVKSLFISILGRETIQHRIYVRKEINVDFLPFCKKSIFKEFLLKLTKTSVLAVDNRLIKQTDGCPMGGAIYVLCL